MLLRKSKTRLFFSTFPRHSDHCRHFLACFARSLSLTLINIWYKKARHEKIPILIKLGNCWNRRKFCNAKEHISFIRVYPLKMCLHWFSTNTQIFKQQQYAMDYSSQKCIRIFFLRSSLSISLHFDANKWFHILNGQAENLIFHTQNAYLHSICNSFEPNNYPLLFGSKRNCIILCISTTNSNKSSRKNHDFFYVAAVDKLWYWSGENDVKLDFILVLKICIYRHERTHKLNFATNFFKEL